MLVKFGNNWIQKNSSDCQIGLGLRPRPIWQSSEFFSSNYFQIGQHVVLLHILINLYISSTRNIFIIPDDAVDRRKLEFLT